MPRLFIADEHGLELWEIDPDGADGQGTLLRDLPSDLAGPSAMTVLGSRLLIAAVGNDDQLWEIDPDGVATEGTLLRTLPSDLELARGMTVLGTRLLIADNDGDELWEIDPDGADTEGTLLRDLPSDLVAPVAMTVLGTRLLIADNDGDELWEIDPDGADTEGTLLRDLPSGLTTPTAMTVLGTRLLIADISPTVDELWEIDPDGADTEGTLLHTLPSSLALPRGMAVLPDAVIEPVGGNAGRAGWTVGARGATGSTVAAVGGEAGRAGWTAGARAVTGSEVVPIGGDAGRAGWTTDASGAAGSGVAPVGGDAGRAGWAADARDATGSVVAPVSGDAGRAGWTADARGATGSLVTPRLFVFDASGDEIFEIDPDGADDQGTLLRELPSGVTQPAAATVLSGRLLVTDATGDDLWEVDPAGADTQGTLLRSLPAGLGGPQGMTVYDGRLLITDAEGDELFEIDPDGADDEGTLLRDLPTSLSSPNAATVLNGRLLVADNVGDELFEIDPDGADTEGTLLRDFPSDLTTPYGMAVYGDRLLVVDFSGAELWEIDPDGADTEGTRLRSLPSGLTFPFAMTVIPLPTAASASGAAGRAGWTAGARNATGSEIAPVGGDAGRSGWTANASGATGTEIASVSGDAGRAAWTADARDATGSLGTPDLTLDAFDDTGLEVLVGMLVEAAAADLYQDGVSGTLVAGSDAALTDDITINQIRWTNSHRVRFWRTGVGHFADFFSGDGSDLTITVQTLTATVTLLVADTFTLMRADSVNFAVDDVADQAAIDAIGDGDRFILAIWRTAVVAPVGGDAGRAGWEFNARAAAGSAVLSVSGAAGRAGWTADARAATGSVVASVNGATGRAGWAADARGATGAAVATVGGNAGRAGWTADAREATGATVAAAGGDAGRAAWTADARGATGSGVAPASGDAARAGWATDARAAAGSEVASVSGSAIRAGWTTDASGATGTAIVADPVGGNAGRAGWTADASGATGSLRAALTPIPRLLIADSAGDELWEINPDGADEEGAVLRLLPDGLDTPRGMAARERILYVIHYAPTQSDVAVWEIDPDGLDAEGEFASGLAHVDNDGGVPAALTTPHGMTTLDGRILVLDDGQDELWQLDPNVSNPNLRTLPSGLISPTGVTVLGTRLLVVDNAGDGLWEINADGADGQGTKLRDLPSNLAGPQGMAAYDGTRLLIADNAGDELWEIDPDGADTEGALLRLLPSDLISPLAMVDFPGLPPVIGNAGRTSWATDARDATGSEVAPVSIGASRAAWTADARGATGSIVPAVGESGRAGWATGVTSVVGSVVPPVVGDAGLSGWAAGARGVTGRHGPVYGSAGRTGWRTNARDATGSVVQPVTGSAGRAGWRARTRRVTGSLGEVDPVTGGAESAGWTTRTHDAAGSVVQPVTRSAGRAGWRTRTPRFAGSLGNPTVGGNAGRTGWRTNTQGATGSQGDPAGNRDGVVSIETTRESRSPSGSSIYYLGKDNEQEMPLHLVRKVTTRVGDDARVSGAFKLSATRMRFEQIHTSREIDEQSFVALSSPGAIINIDGQTGDSKRGAEIAVATIDRTREKLVERVTIEREVRCLGLWSAVVGRRASTAVFTDLKASDAIRIVLEAVDVPYGEIEDTPNAILSHWWLSNKDNADQVLLGLAEVGGIRARLDDYTGVVTFQSDPTDVDRLKIYGGSEVSGFTGESHFVAPRTPEGTGTYTGQSEPRPIPADKLYGGFTPYQSSLTYRYDSFHDRYSWFVQPFSSFLYGAFSYCLETIRTGYDTALNRHFIEVLMTSNESNEAFSASTFSLSGPDELYLNFRLGPTAYVRKLFTDSADADWSDLGLRVGSLGEVGAAAAGDWYFAENEEVASQNIGHYRFEVTEAMAETIGRFSFILTDDRDAVFSNIEPPGESQRLTFNNWERRDDDSRYFNTIKVVRIVRALEPASSVLWESPEDIEVPAASSLTIEITSNDGTPFLLDAAPFTYTANANLASITTSRSSGSEVEATITAGASDLVLQNLQAMGRYYVSARERVFIQQDDAARAEDGEVLWEGGGKFPESLSLSYLESWASGQVDVGLERRWVAVLTILTHDPGYDSVERNNWATMLRLKPGRLVDIIHRRGEWLGLVREIERTSGSAVGHVDRYRLAVELTGVAESQSNVLRLGLDVYGSDKVLG